MIASRTSSVAIPAFGERHRIKRNADGGLVGAADGNFADAWHLRNTLRNHGIGDVIDRAGGNRLRCQRQHEYRRRGGIGFSEARQTRQIARQIGESRVDRGLHVARGAVDIAAYRELELDAGCTQ